MNTRTMATLAGLLLMAPTAAKLADAPPAPDKPVTEVRDPDKHVAALSAAYDVTPERIKELRAKGMGWGEIRHALAISKRANVPLEDVLKQRRSEKGWGQVARHYGFSLGEVSGKGADRSDRKDARADDRARGRRDDGARRDGPGAAKGAGASRGKGAGQGAKK
ncbi:MAG: hypothetical protein HY078_00880 [Elusimicrobia bacterium]|nr:hypothetical protein [Elusimicrobiota bacterium]